MPPQATLEFLERAGRTCYLSEDKIKPGTAEKFVRSLLDKTPPHESVIEHVSATVSFTVDRGVSHELVRHRLASYSQESTRFCDYGDENVTYIIPPWVHVEPNIYEQRERHLWTGWDVVDPDYIWLTSMFDAEEAYHTLRKAGWKAEQARDVLPISLKTVVVATYNLRTWRHVFRMRTAEKCHPQMTEVMRPLLLDFKTALPAIFDDIRV